jgi:putative hemin transport protein
MTQAPTVAAIRQARLDNPKTRDRDLASQLGISEAQLVAAHVGHWATRIHAHPDHLMPQVSKLGEVMALTRNDSAVHERVGTYGEYHSGKHASMVLGKEIDLRVFAKHWVHGYAIEQQTEKGPRRTLQVFDAAGDAVHKVFLRETSNHDAWNEVVAALKVEDQSKGQEVDARKPTEGARINPEKRDILLDEWARMTDTHQFNRLASKLGMNRLGAYRLITGERWVRPLEIGAVEQFLNATSEAGQLVVLFVGNMGNIQIHWGSLDNIKPMGPWLNVLDERFNLHLRGDKISEVYAIEKPTKRGPAVSVEAFDAEGGIILQIFGQRVDESDDLSSWQKLVDDLPTLKEKEIA